MTKIFQIGFNRCGTMSIYHFFNKNGLKSIHWGRGALAAGIEAAHFEGKLLLTYIEGFDVYCDMEFMREDHAGEWISEKPFEKLFVNYYGQNMPIPIYAFERFKELDQQYPGSKFILNTRDQSNWIRSRKKFLKSGYFFCIHGDSVHPNEYELDECWINHWNSHHNAVLEYFSDRPGALLEFNIERDSPKKLVDFFEYLNLDVTHWGHHNKGNLSVVDFSQTEWKPFSESN